MNKGNGKPRLHGATSQAQYRRMVEGFFPNYCPGSILDIGFGGDPLFAFADTWDIEDGDAQKMDGVANESYNTVYSSHLLEHVADCEEALARWWELVKKGGYLILYLPHRDLYEKRKELPSRWNPDHKRFFMPIADEPPCTVGVAQLIANVLPEAEFIYMKTCDEGHTITDPNVHSDGEFSIEVVLRKKG